VFFDPCIKKIRTYMVKESLVKPGILEIEAEKKGRFDEKKGYCKNSVKDYTRDFPGNQSKCICQAQIVNQY